MRAGTMEKQMAAHIIPRTSRTDTTAAQNARSASCGPPSPMAFDPAAAASATLGQEEDGVYIRAGQSPKRNDNSSKLGGGSTGPLGGGFRGASAAAWPASAASMPSKFAPANPPSMGGLRGSSGAAPSMNALSAPAHGSALARFAAKSSEEAEEEEEDRERDEYVNLRSKQALQPAAVATFVLQDPEEQDTAGLRAYSGRKQLDVAAKRVMVDLRLDPGSANVRPALFYVHIPAL